MGIRKPPRGKSRKNDIVDNFSEEVDDMIDDIDDEVDTRPMSPKEYTSYRKPEASRRRSNDNYEDEQENFEREGRQQRPPNQRNEGNRRNQKPSRGNRPPGVEKPQRRGSTTKSKSSGGKTTLMGVLFGLFVVLVMGVAVFFLVTGGMKDDKENKNNTTAQSQNANQDKQQFQSMEKPNKDVQTNSTTENNNNNNSQVTPGASMDDTNAINPGLPNTENGQNKVNNGKLTPSGDFLKDVNGNQIPANYEVKQVKEETDFVNYEKRRGVTGDGVELLWLDAEYKGIPYTVQVPFKIWKELDPKGITVVSMEVLYLDQDRKVISFMSVKENYKELLEKKNSGSSW